MAERELKYSRFFLPNGVKGILYQRKEVHSVNISVVVNAGSLDETEETNGISHFTEHMPFDGTSELPTWDKVNDFQNNISGSSNAYTSFDHTKYYGTFPPKYVDEAVFYLSQLVLHPLHRKEDLEKERVIIIDEMRSYEDSIGHKLYRTMIENRFNSDKTSFCYDIIGTNENLTKFKRKDIIQNFDKQYVPENFEIYVVGNFEIQKIKKILKKYFYDDIKKQSYGKKPARSFYNKYPEYSGFNINVGQKLDLNQYYLTISFPCYEFALTSQAERNLIPFVAAITASSQYQNSILWKRLREELGIVYEVSAWTHTMYNRAFFAIETSFNPEFLEKVMTEIYSGVTKILKKDFSDEIFKSRQKRIIDTELMRYDSPNNVLNWIVDQEDEFEVHKKNLSIDQYLELVKNYRFSDVLDTSKDIFDWKHANITVVSKDDPTEIKTKVERLWKKITK